MCMEFQLEFFEKGAVDGSLRKVLGMLLTGFSSCCTHSHHLCTQFQTNVGKKVNKLCIFSPPTFTFFG